MTQPEDETKPPVLGLGGGANSSEMIWGMASQGFSSLTNLGLSLVAARALGPEGLGIVFVGFSLYLLLLGFARALLSDPLVALTTNLNEDARRLAQRSALTILTFVSIGVVALVTLTGLLVPDPIGPGLIAFAPWLFPVLLQDFWRVVLFQQRRGRAGAMNDLSWVIVMATTVPLAFRIGELWAVVACWGLGGAAAATLGFFQTRLRLARGPSSLRWWRVTAWPMGRWLGLEGVAYGLATQGLVFVLVFLLGPSQLGGLRAVQSVYAPLSLVSAALALPALPEISRRLSQSLLKARQYAARLGILAIALSGAYILLTAVGGKELLAWLFGDAFAGFEKLAWPVGAAQLIGAVVLGFPLLLKAQQRSQELLVAALIGSSVTLAASTLLAIPAGIQGAAWGMTLGVAAKGGLTAVLAVRRTS